MKHGGRSSCRGVLALASRRRVRQLHNLCLGRGLGRGGERLAEVLRRLLVTLFERDDDLLDGPVRLKVIQTEEERRETPLEDELVHLRGRIRVSAGSVCLLGWPGTERTVGRLYSCADEAYSIDWGSMKPPSTVVVGAWTGSDGERARLAVLLPEVDAECEDELLPISRLAERASDARARSQAMPSLAPLTESRGGRMTPPKLRGGSRN